MNFPNWTGNCTKHGVRVAIEIKHLMRALGDPHEYLSAPKIKPREGVFRGAEVLMGGLTSIATLTSCLVQLPVQLGKFADFWGLPVLRFLEAFHLVLNYFCNIVPFRDKDPIIICSVP